MDYVVSAQGEAKLCLALAKQLEELAFDSLVAVARGGLIPGIYLSHYFDKRLVVIEVSSYEERCRGEVKLKGSFPSIKGQKILLVDDLVDSGRTIDVVRRELERAGNIVITAALLAKGEAECDYFVRRVPSNRWVCFWYEHH